jgi:hypothetical protein
MLKEEIKGISRRYILQSLCLLAVVTLIPALLSLLTNVGNLTVPTIVALSFAVVVEAVDALVWGKVRQAGDDGLPTFYTAVSGFRMLLALATLVVCYFVVDENLELAACAGNDNALHGSVKYHLFGGNDFQIQTHRYKTLMMMLTLGCLKQSLTLSNSVLDGSHVEECLLWQVVYLSVENHVEALDGVLDRNHHARYAGELLGYGERL